MAKDTETLADFDWGRCTCQAKEDGSLLIVYAYHGSWRLGRSNSGEPRAWNLS